MDTNFLELKEQVEYALRKVLRNAQDNYFNGVSKYSVVDVCESKLGGKWIFAVDSDASCIELRRRSEELPEGDLGWYAITVCRDNLPFTKVVDTFVYLIGLVFE